MERGKLFRLSRFFVRLKLGPWTVEVPPPKGPTVYVCSHSNLLGPLACLCHLPFPVRPWVLHVFTDRQTCAAHYRDYTFPRRLGMPSGASAALAWSVSGFVSALMDSLGAIPVYRGTVRLKETFRETVEALRSGDSVLVFPDVDYTSEEKGVGEVYDGFLLVDRLWRRVSEEPLDFVPLRLDRERRTITAGKPVRFGREKESRTVSARRAETVRVREALRREMNEKLV